MKKQSFLTVAVLVVAAAFFCGCPPAPISNDNPPDETITIPETTDGSLVISGDLFESLNDKNLSSAGMANLASRMIEKSEVVYAILDEFVNGEWTGRTWKDEAISIIDGKFEIIFPNIPTGMYKLYCWTSQRGSSGGVCHLFESDYECQEFRIAGNTKIEITLGMSSVYYFGMAIHGLPGVYESSHIEPGQCCLIDSVGQKYDFPSPDGSGEGVWKLGRPDQTLCNSVNLPWQAEIVEFKILDSNGVEYSMPLQYDGFKYLEGISRIFNFPETGNLDVDFNIELQTPPTLTLTSTGGGYYEASFSTGDFHFTGAEWVADENGGVADGYELLIGSNDLAQALGEVYLSESFSLYWGSIELLPAECHDFRVILDGEVLNSTAVSQSFGCECGWMIPATE